MQAVRLEMIHLNVGLYTMTCTHMQHLYLLLTDTYMLILDTPVNVDLTDKVNSCKHTRKTLYKDQLQPQTILETYSKLCSPPS